MVEADSEANHKEEDSKKDHPEAEVGLKFLYSSIVCLAYSLLEEHKSVLLLKTSSLENLFTIKNASVFKLTAKRLNIVFGILTDPKSQPQLQVEWQR